MRKAFLLGRVLLIVPFLLFSLTAASQPGNPGGGGKPVPITGIEVLIGLGGALGLKKMISKRKNNL
jgi:hypothetical protein